MDDWRVPLSDRAQDAGGSNGALLVKAVLRGHISCCAPATGSWYRVEVAVFLRSKSKFCNSVARLGGSCLFGVGGWASFLRCGGRLDGYDMRRMHVPGSAPKLRSDSGPMNRLTFGVGRLIADL